MAGGRQARLQFTLAPILDAEGRVAGVIAIGQDRTEVRELEGQVIHAEKLATLGQLAAGIVHEINNPLTSISVYGEYLLSKLSRTGAEASDLKRVERILRSADRILSFTRNLLAYARPSREEAQPVSTAGLRRIDKLGIDVVLAEVRARAKAKAKAEASVEAKA